MPVPVVWTERGEYPGVVGLHDCTQSAVLDALIYGGYTNFPEGIYTMEERNLLERSDDKTPEDRGTTFPDMDVAVARRYGLKLHILPDNSDATLRAYLSKPGYAFALAGQLSNLPAGDFLRRHQPSYTGGHAICVITLGGGKVLWLDPLAENKYKGDITTVDKAMLFAWTGNAYSRYVIKDEFAPEDAGEINMHLNPVEDWWVIKPNTPFWVNGPDPTYQGMDVNGGKSTNEPTGHFKGTPDGLYDLSTLEEWTKKGDTWTSGDWRFIPFPPGTPGRTSGVWAHRADLIPARQGGALAYRDFMNTARWKSVYDPKTDTVKSPFPSTSGFTQAEVDTMVEKASDLAREAATKAATTTEKNKWLAWYGKAPK